ncbi:MAG: 50S ribosomal protein L31 [Acidimicrobiia bacterium]
MKTGIHPDYVEATVTCSCGNTFQTRATKADIHVELCNDCHPFFTGKQKLVDSGGRVERFQRRYGKTSFTSEQASEDTPAAQPEEAEPPEETSDEAGEPVDETAAEAEADATADL